MPFGDPAGYLPNVRKSRKRKGQPEYQPKSKYVRRAERQAAGGARPMIDPGTGGAVGPRPMPMIDRGTGGAVGPRPMKRTRRFPAMKFSGSDASHYKTRKRRKRARD